MHSPLGSQKCPGDMGLGQQVQGLLCHLKVRPPVLGDWGCLCLVSKEGDGSEECSIDLGLSILPMGLCSLPRREGRREACAPQGPDGCAVSWSWVFLAQTSVICIEAASLPFLPPALAWEVLAVVSGREQSRLRTSTQAGH